MDPELDKFLREENDRKNKLTQIAMNKCKINN